MYNKYFSERLRLLREYHNLSLNQLADILGKKKSAISEIEAGRIGTTLDVLTNISNLFAVSVDWLLGRTDEPYSLSVINKLEINLIKLEEGISLEKNTALNCIKLLFHFCKLKGQYWSNRDSYSLDQRAEVIYALNFLIYACNKLDEPIYTIDEIKEFLTITEKTATFGIIKNQVVTTMIDKVTASCTSKRAGTAFAKLCYECLETLNELAYRQMKVGKLRQMIQKQL